MRAITSGRLALVLALLALVVATGGVGYAAGKITGNQIASNAITSPKVKNGSLTGQDLRESTLARVPSAGNAQTTNGVRASRIFYQVDAGGPVRILVAQGLTLTASCSGSTDNGDGAVTLVATSSVQNASIYAIAGSDKAPGDPREDDLEGGQFDPGTPFDLLAGSNGNISMVTFEFDRPDGHVVTGQLAVDENGQRTCSVTGMAFSQ